MWIKLCFTDIHKESWCNIVCPLYIHTLFHRTLNSSCRQVLQFGGVISSLNLPEWDNIGPAELIVLQGCSHYSASKNLKSKSALNLRNSIRACFHLKFSPTQFTRLPCILPWVITHFRQSFLPSTSGKNFVSKGTLKKEKKKRLLSDPHHSFSSSVD